MPAKGPRYCDYPGCEDMVDHDLVLSARGRSVGYNSSIGKRLRHWYLCEKHAHELLDFISATMPEVERRYE